MSVITNEDGDLVGKGPSVSELVAVQDVELLVELDEVVVVVVVLLLVVGVTSSFLQDAISGITRLPMPSFFRNSFLSITLNAVD
jgi:hypothetical protein